MSNVSRRASVAVGASLFLLLVACGSSGGEQAEVNSAPATAIPTTAPLTVPTATPPAPTATAAPVATSTPIPVATPIPAATDVPTPEPTVAPTETPVVDPNPTVAPAEAAAPTATVVAEVIETATPVPTVTVEADGDPAGADPTPTAVAETPTAVVASGEPPLECYDAQIQVYRAYVEGVDVISFENGQVFCNRDATNTVSAAGSYRLGSGLIMQRNADFIFNDAGTAYIPYSGSIHFCLNGQPGSAPVRANTVPALLVVIDNEDRVQVAQGATGPLAFTAGGAQC